MQFDRSLNVFRDAIVRPVSFIHDKGNTPHHAISPRFARTAIPVAWSSSTAWPPSCCVSFPKEIGTQLMPRHFAPGYAFDLNRTFGGYAAAPSQIPVYLGAADI
jgi:hypothetical protein